MQRGALFFMQFTGCDQPVIRQKMQFTGWDNGNWMRNATCVETQTSKAPTQVNLLSIPYTVFVALKFAWLEDHRTLTDSGRSDFDVSSKTFSKGLLQ